MDRIVLRDPALGGPHLALSSSQSMDEVFSPRYSSTAEPNCSTDAHSHPCVATKESKFSLLICCTLSKLPLPSFRLSSALE